MVDAQVDSLDVASRTQIPEVNPMAVLVAEQVLGNDTVWNSGGSPHSLDTMSSRGRFHQKS